MDGFANADVIPLKKDLVLSVSSRPNNTICWCGSGSKFAVGSADSTIYFYDIHSLTYRGKPTS